jgi:hypothetical protein
MMKNLSSEKKARHRNVGVEIIYSRAAVILFSLQCCQGPLNRKGIYRIIRLSELKGSSLVHPPNFTGEKTQAHLYKGSNTLRVLSRDKCSGRNVDLELDLHTQVEMGKFALPQGKSMVRERQRAEVSQGRQRQHIAVTKEASQSGFRNPGR